MRSIRFSAVLALNAVERPGRFYEIESCLVFLIAYTSYFFSNAFTMSGTLVAASSNLALIVTNRDRLAALLRNHPQALRVS